MQNLNTADVINRSFILDRTIRTSLTESNHLVARVPDEQGQIHVLNAFEASSYAEIKRAKMIRDNRLKND